MVDQREALAVTTDFLTRFIWFALPGFEPPIVNALTGLIGLVQPLSLSVSFSQGYFVPKNSRKINELQ